jgi:hypothetical protein
MKQLLIAKSNTVLNKTASGTLSNANSLKDLVTGSLCFFTPDDNVILSAKPTKNFAIALGRPSANGEMGSGRQQNTFLIPEVDINTLTVTKALPKLGKAFSRTFTMPAVNAEKEITVMFVKRDVVPHERNKWHITVIASGTAATDAQALVDAVNNSELPFTASRSTAAVTITADKINDQWDIQLLDAISTVAFTTKVEAEPTIGDKEYIKNIAIQCAGDKGFFYTHSESRDFIPGFPENVENLTVNASGTSGASTAGYVLYTLRFAVGRNSAKTRDEVVNQIVHIAIPLDSNSTPIQTIDYILGLATPPAQSNG